MRTQSLGTEAGLSFSSVHLNPVSLARIPSSSRSLSGKPCIRGLFSRGLEVTAEACSVASREFESAGLEIVILITGLAA